MYLYFVGCIVCVKVRTDSYIFILCRCYKTVRNSIFSLLLTQLTINWKKIDIVTGKEGYHALTDIELVLYGNVI